MHLSKSAPVASTFSGARGGWGPGSWGCKISNVTLGIFEVSTTQCGRNTRALTTLLSEVCRRFVWPHGALIVLIMSLWFLWNLWEDLETHYIMWFTRTPRRNFWGNLYIFHHHQPRIGQIRSSSSDPPRCPSPCGSQIDKILKQKRPRQDTIMQLTE